MEKPVFIIFSDRKPQFDHLGKYLGEQSERAVFYLPEIGRKRLYRQSFRAPIKGAKLLTYKSKKGAEKVCQSLNEKAGDEFKVLSYLKV